MIIGCIFLPFKEGEMITEECSLGGRSRERPQSRLIMIKQTLIILQNMAIFSFLLHYMVVFASEHGKSYKTIMASLVVLALQVWHFLGVTLPGNISQISRPLEQFQRDDPNERALCPLFVRLGRPDGRVCPHFKMGRLDRPMRRPTQMCRREKKTRTKKNIIKHRWPVKHRPKST